MTWAKTEGRPPETSRHCVRKGGENARKEGKEKVILFNYSGHGLMDLSGYDAFMSGRLTDYELPEEELLKYTKDLEKLPKAEMRKSGRW
jgi:tryptophan synthase beta chain